MFEESEIPGSLWNPFPNFHRSDSAMNFTLFIQQLPSSNLATRAVDSKDEEDDVVITGTNDFAAQAVDSKGKEEEEDVDVTGTNSDSNSELQSDSYMMYMNEQLPPLDSGLEHEITKSKAPVYDAVDSSNVASCSNFDSAFSPPSIRLSNSELDLLNPFMVSSTVDSNVEASSSKSNDLVPPPMNYAISSSDPLPMPPAAVVDFVSENQQFNVVNNTQFQPPVANANGITSYYNFADEFVPPSLNSAVTTDVVSSPLPMAPPHPHAVDFNSVRAYYKSRPDISCAAPNQVNQQFNVVNNTQFQPPVANTNGITSYYNFADEFVPPSLNFAVTTGVVSSPLPMAPPHPHAVDKSRPDISCAAANQVNQQFNVGNNTQWQPPIANTNVFQFRAKITENSDEAKRQRRKQANLESARQSRKRRQDVMKKTKEEVEDLKKIASELLLACLERKEKCETSHYWNRTARIECVTIIARAYTYEEQLMRVTGIHPLDDPVFQSIAENAGLNLSDVRSLIHAPTYLTSPIAPYLNQLVSTFSNAPHPQGQQVQNQSFLNTGLHGAMPGWDNNRQIKY